MNEGLQQRPQPGVGSSLLWVLFSFAMWFWAITGPVLAAVGIASFYTDVSSFLTIPGRDAASLGSVLGAVGLSFVWLRVRGHLRFGDE